MSSIEQQFKLIFDDQKFNNHELWVIKALGKIITLRSGNNSWHSENAAKKAWANHIGRRFRRRYNVKTGGYNVFGPQLPAGTKQKDFTEWCIQNKLVEFVRIA